MVLVIVNSNGAGNGGAGDASGDCGSGGDRAGACTVGAHKQEVSVYLYM